MKSLRQVVPILVVVTLAALLSGCSKNSNLTAPAALDEAPPAAPTQLMADIDAATSGPVLAWTPSPSANVAGYQVYQYSPSPDRDNAYVMVGETDAGTTQYPLPSPAEAAIVYYRLRSVSSSGTLSAWSAILPVTVGPPQGGDDDPVGIKQPTRKP